MTPKIALQAPDAALVTGGTGFLGSRLVERLLRRRSVCVWIIARHPPPALLDGRVAFVRHDLARPLDGLDLPTRIRTVYHCASPRDGTAAELLAPNVQGTLELLAYAARAKARRFVYVSSGGVCGYDDQPIPEDARPAPGSPHLMSKLAGELALRAAESSVPFTIVRLFFPYGPGQRRGLIPLLCDRIIRGEPVVVGVGGAPSLNPIHVRDAVRLLARMGEARRAGPVVNLAGREVTNVRALAERLARHLGRRPVFRPDRTRRDHLVGDTRLLLREYGRPSIGLDRGLAEFIRWWKDSRG
jgi:UDP-glucose 4-epimerase